MDQKSAIWVAGHRGLVGSAIVRRLKAEGYSNLILRTHAEVDLTNQAATNEFVAASKPEYVFLAAARVGGILANDTARADFIRDNLLIQTNVIDASWRNGVKKLLFLGSSCIYPKLAPQPIPEEALLTGPLEPTNEPYAIAKIAGLKMVEAYRRQYGFDAISVMPTNLYGPGDNFDLQSSHVLPALIRKFHDAKESGAATVTIWGTGSPKREFLHVDDLADACLFVMDRYSAETALNVGSGEEVTIAELASIVAEAVGYRGELVYDRSKPDGTPRKLVDSMRIRSLGWRPQVNLVRGVGRTYEWYLKSSAAVPVSA